MGTQQATSLPLHRAIRAACEAADIHLACAYPECGCVKLPAAVTAAAAILVETQATPIMTEDAEPDTTMKDVAMLAHRLTVALSKTEPGNALARSASEYLSRRKLGDGVILGDPPV